jgi:hypothetical protein
MEIKQRYCILGYKNCEKNCNNSRGNRGCEVCTGNGLASLLNIYIFKAT